jgi:pyrimidine-nucleoside phosphorylase
MRMYDIIVKKRDNHELTPEEINFFIREYASGSIPDYQVSALLMAIFFNGLTPRETADLTIAMVESGEVVDLSSIPGIKVDKHSTGGVGDKTTLVLAPLVAAAGVPVAKMSGRGLGHTGGTIDKLESIPGFNVSLPPQSFLKQVKDIKVAVAAQTGELAPADKKLYALRDVTGTVDSIPLIASSVMSKKIASGANAIVLDVKFGSGAFMKSLEKARILARTMVETGKATGRETIAMITNMDQPLGNAVGNALEMNEAINTLKGEGPRDLVELCLELGSHMLVAGKITASRAEARKELQRLLTGGKALEKFEQMISFQGGDTAVLSEPEKLPQAREIYRVTSPVSGYISAINAEQVGRAAMLLGAGRESKEDSIDPAVGIVVTKKVGDKVQKDETIAILHFNNEAKLEEAKQLLTTAYRYSEQPPEQAGLVHDIVN